MLFGWRLVPPWFTQALGRSRFCAPPRDGLGLKKMKPKRQLLKPDRVIRASDGSDFAVESIAVKPLVRASLSTTPRVSAQQIRAPK